VAVRWKPPIIHLHSQSWRLPDQSVCHETGDGRQCCVIFFAVFIGTPECAVQDVFERGVPTASLPVLSFLQPRYLARPALSIPPRLSSGTLRGRRPDLSQAAVCAAATVQSVAGELQPSIAPGWQSFYELWHRQLAGKLRERNLSTEQAAGQHVLQIDLRHATVSNLLIKTDDT